MRVSIAARALVCIEHDSKEHTRHIDSDLTSNSPDSRWDDDVLGGLKGRVATPPALGTGHGDDHMRQCHLEAAEKYAGQNRDDRAKEAACTASKEVHNQSLYQGVKDGNVQASETGKWASDRADMLDCGAEFGCDGCLFDEEEVCFQSPEVLLIVFLIIGEEGRVSVDRD